MCPYACMCVSLCYHACVLILECMCPYAIIYVSSCYYVSVLILICVFPYASMRVSLYSYACVLIIMIGVCPYAILHVSFCFHVCPHALLHMSSRFYIISSNLKKCVLMYICMCPYVSCVDCFDRQTQTGYQHHSRLYAIRVVPLSSTRAIVPKSFVNIEIQRGCGRMAHRQGPQ